MKGSGVNKHSFIYSGNENVDRMHRIIRKVRGERFYHKSRPHIGKIGRPWQQRTDECVAWIKWFDLRRDPFALDFNEVLFLAFNPWWSAGIGSHLGICNVCCLRSESQSIELKFRLVLFADYCASYILMGIHTPLFCVQPLQVSRDLCRVQSDKSEENRCISHEAILFPPHGERRDFS